jgi:hypothetical protein
MTTFSPEDNLELDPQEVSGKFKKLKTVNHVYEYAGEFKTLRETTLKLSFLKDPKQFNDIFFSMGTRRQDSRAASILKAEAFEGELSI